VPKLASLAGNQNRVDAGIVWHPILIAFAMTEAIVRKTRQKKATGRVKGAIFLENKFPQIQSLTENLPKCLENP
jgi:hypothetical protein